MRKLSFKRGLRNSKKLMLARFNLKLSAMKGDSNTLLLKLATISMIGCMITARSANLNLPESHVSRDMAMQECTFKPLTSKYNKQIKE